MAQTSGWRLKRGSTNPDPTSCSSDRPIRSGDGASSSHTSWPTFTHPHLPSHLPSHLPYTPTTPTLINTSSHTYTTQPPHVPARQLGKRSDIFSFGMVLWEILSLSSPPRAQAPTNSETLMFLPVFHKQRHRLPLPESARTELPEQARPSDAATTSRTHVHMHACLHSLVRWLFLWSD